MSYRTLLVHADNSAASETRTIATFELAGRLEATVIGLAAGLVRPVVDPYSGAVAGLALESERDELEAELKAAAAKFSALATKATVPHEFRTAIDFPTQAMIAAASAADLIIVGREKTGFAYDAYADVAPGDVLMGSGRPILVLPPEATAINPSSILVAWKGTREARRALSDALPFLKKAEKVVVVEIANDTDDADAELVDVRAFLKGHKVEAIAKRVAPRKSSAEEQLLAIAKEEGADLLVAGGYGHARLREWMFGGVTRALLRDSPLPVFLSH